MPPSKCGACNGGRIPSPRRARRPAHPTARAVWASPAPSSSRSQRLSQPALTSRGILGRPQSAQAFRQHPHCARERAHATARLPTDPRLRATGPRRAPTALRPVATRRIPDPRPCGRSQRNGGLGACPARNAGTGSLDRWVLSRKHPHRFRKRVSSGPRSQAPPDRPNRVGCRPTGDPAGPTADQCRRKDGRIPASPILASRFSKLGGSSPDSRLRIPAPARTFCVTMT